jgi:CRISPR-associated exonuclease Cas4
MSDLISIALLLLSAVLLLLALWLAWRARSARLRSGLPQGRLVYADTAAWSEVSKPYYSERHRLTGKPDYLVDGDDGLIPVEVKAGPAPPGGKPYASHILQLAAYCLLLEDAHGQAPPYGYIHYAGATVQIDFDDALRARLIETLAAMRQSLAGPDVARSHDDPARCAACGVRHACGRQAL